MATEFLAVAIVAVILGILIGKFWHIKSANTDGFIILDKNEEGNDRLVFQLGMDYDEIAQHNEIHFKVVKQAAKK